MVPPELEFEKFLGKGSFGSVSLFKYSKPRTTILYTAVKTSDYNHASSLYNEFQILSQLKGCPRIVQCYGNSVIPNLDGEGGVEYMMLMEYARAGSLRSFMNRFKDNKLPEPLIKQFTRMILEGLVAIHRQGYVHSDLKPENILVFPCCDNRNGYEVKISDFGMSKREGDSDWWEPNRPFAGTPIYMSPESVSHGETRKGLDLWSLGCVVLEMYTGKRPWWHKKYDLEDLKNCHEPLIPSHLPFDARLFVMTCFALEVEDRRDAFTLLQHSFLRQDSSNMTKPLVDVMVMSILERLKELKSIKVKPLPFRPNLVAV